MACRSMRLSTDADMTQLISSLSYYPQSLLFESLQDEQTLSRLPEPNIRFLHTSSHLNHHTFVQNDETHHIQNNAVENDKKQTIDREHAQRVMKNKTVYVKRHHFHQVNEELLIRFNTDIALQCGQSEIRLEPDGSIFINGKNLQIKVEDHLNMLSTIVKVN